MCLENYPGNRFYGSVTTSVRVQAAACSLLIPFLKKLTAAIVEAQGQGLGLEDQEPGAGKAAASLGYVLISFNIIIRASGTIRAWPRQFFRKNVEKPNILYIAA